jgi:hypothetical protein
MNMARSASGLINWSGAAAVAAGATACEVVVSRVTIGTSFSVPLMGRRCHCSGGGPERSSSGIHPLFGYWTDQIA